LKPLSREAMRLMQRYDWPGNIRQLENMIRSYILIGSEEALTADLVPSAPAGPARLDTQLDLTKPVSLKEITRAATQDLERQIILKVLEANAWSRRKTAKWLNISYRSLLYKLQETQLSGSSEAPSQAANSAAISIPHQATAPAKEIRPMWTGSASS
jgi:two-component system response regulator AtoC